MMKFKYIIILVSMMLLLSFQQKKSDTIKGLWTDKSTENATFEIKDKIIYYSDYVYEAKVSFSKGVLILKSSDGSVSKFWRFKG